MTSQEVKKLRLELEEAKAALYKSSNSLSADEINKKEEEMNKKLKELEDLVAIRLVVAFDPSDNFINEVSETLQVQLGKEPLLEIEVDRSILGGAIIELSGRFYDYSLRKVFEEKYAQL